ncbi:hypothetical protein IGB42_01873 [Andreprevotia sp. IGB-42]|uniref:hypothetical protein n=1 Tax=Andreprevotia sp. IGB-42 TaxID=2497473 RepID=UPI00135C374F|nr:hypothetical protein [Andreprevotia sp. IGB-42]KAF0813522.1 hypothetical protein IGB42_01873 [Andreprevotia sp. IGB-42]
MLDDDLLALFLASFYGYGNLAAPIWFIGMDEPGNNTLAHISQRLQTWEERGATPLEDLAGFHQAIGSTRFFDETAVPHPTWSRLIRVLLASQGQPCDAADLLRYQVQQLARNGGGSCLMELLPLLSTRKWLYATHSHLPQLQSRAICQRTLAPPRGHRLHAMLQHYQPRQVVFYGKSHRRHWLRIAGQANWQSSADGFEYAGNAHTQFVITHHPAARGLHDDYFHKVGEHLAAHTPAIAPKAPRRR